MALFFDAAIGYAKKRWAEIRKTLVKDNLWKRMLRNVVATTVIIGLCLINSPNSPFGSAAYLAVMMSVFSYPGRRFGQLVETLILALAGGFLGMSWTICGLYLSSLLILDSPNAAYTVRAIFLIIALMFHGYLRSHTPRLSVLVLLFIIECASGLTSTATHVTGALVAQLIYPILMATPVLFFVGIFIFPEFSSGFLGKTAIEAIHDAAEALSEAADYFVRAEITATKTTSKASKASSPDTAENTDGSKPDKPRNDLAKVTLAKPKLRKNVAICKSAQRECQFEIAYSALPPRAMKPISTQMVKKLVANIIAVIGACESRFALLGDTLKPENEIATSAKEPMASPIPESSGSLDDDVVESHYIELVKPQREIEFGDVHLLRYLLEQIRESVLNVQTEMKRSVDVITACLAYAFDVPSLPSGAKPPGGIPIAEIDVHFESIQAALDAFDTKSAKALEEAAMLQDLAEGTVDVMPREEVFLISSFLLNFRQAIAQLMEILLYSRKLVEKRQKHQRRRLYAPNIHWERWLYSGGDGNESQFARGHNAKMEARRSPTPNDSGAEDEADDTDTPDALSRRLEEARGLRRRRQRSAGGSPISTSSQRNNSPDEEVPSTRSLRIRGLLADAIEWMQHSEDLLYAFKLTIAALLVTWPGLVPSLNNFYSSNRGTWAVLQLVLVFEAAIGTSIMTFFLRAIGTTLGSLWGWAAYQSRAGSPVVCAFMLFLGLIPAVYVQLGSKWPKAGMVTIVSMGVVALATELRSLPESGAVTFLQRWLAFLIGGVVALLVEVILLPVKARTSMVQSLAVAILKISDMEGFIAYGIEDGLDLTKGFPPEVLVKFELASCKAKAALSAAGTLLPFCSTEPRLKGSFAGLALIYSEILFVLHQIVDRMDNMLQLRTVYGSGPLEEFNSQIYPYRRNTAGAIALVLYAVHEALTTKLPLPQFLPSARIAHLRLINKVRDTVQKSVDTGSDGEEVDKLVWKHALRRKYMAWNAAAAAQIEIIEYLEELTDLAKLLVGANEFRSGLLTRPTYREYMASARRTDWHALVDDEAPQESDPVGSKISAPSAQDKGRGTALEASESDKIPASLQRIQSRKAGAALRKGKTREG